MEERVHQLEAVGPVHRRHLRQVIVVELVAEQAHHLEQPLGRHVQLQVGVDDPRRQLRR